MYEDEALQLSAAIAYYALLSMAPVFLIAIAVAGIFFADGQVQRELVAQMRDLVGPQGAALTQTVIDSTETQYNSALSLVVGVVLMFFGATVVFAQLQNALNRVWRVEAKPGNALLSFIKSRLLAFVLALSIGFLLMVSLVISAVLGVLHTYLDSRLAQAALFWQGLDTLITFMLATVLVTALFKFLPDAEIEWRDSWVGGVITSFLFIIGKRLIGLYLGQTTVASSFGAAGSVVVFMIWVYYASLILLLGAEITQAVAAERGARIVPSEHAEPRKE